MNDDEVIDEDDRAWIGTPHPDFEYGTELSTWMERF